VEPHRTETLQRCPICGSEALVPALQVRDHTCSLRLFQFTDCLDCSFRFTNPRPTLDAIGNFYLSNNYISHGHSEGGILERVYRFVRQRAIRRKHRMIAKYKPSGHILDFGCGTGDFLGYLRSRGYQVVGVEPSIRARELAVQNHSLVVVPFINALPALEQFHVTTMWHVLEHVHDVRETLRKVYARMALGALLVVAVPDRESWDAEFYGADWAAYDAPRHLSHFRRKDMCQLLADQGFELLNIRGMWFDAPYVSILSERQRGTGRWLSLFKGALIGCFSNLIALVSTKPTSSSLYLARKKR